MIYCLSGSVIGVKKPGEVKHQMGPSVRKGPMEGMIIVDGHSQMEHCDMPTISFSEESLKRLIDHYKAK